MSKSCFNCNHCYDNEVCVLRDDLIIGYCFLHNPNEKRGGDK